MINTIGGSTWTLTLTLDNSGNKIVNSFLDIASDGSGSKLAVSSQKGIYTSTSG